MSKFELCASLPMLSVRTLQCRGRMRDDRAIVREILLCKHSWPALVKQDRQLGAVKLHALSCSRGHVKSTLSRRLQLRAYSRGNVEVVDISVGRSIGLVPFVVEIGMAEWFFQFGSVSPANAPIIV